MKNSILKKNFKLFRKQFKSFQHSLKKVKLQHAYEELQVSYESLQNYKELLEQRVDQEIEKREINEKILRKQSRFAAMGEMMDAVAHQWLQPLTLIDLHINLMPDALNNNQIDKEYIDKTVTAINRQTTHLTKTLNQFRNFLKPIDKNEYFDLNIMVKETLALLKDVIMQNELSISHENEEEQIIIYGSHDEISHVLINLINNAKDAFNEKKIINRSIIISTRERALYASVTLRDNAGGIENDIIKDIFKPYVSTKESTTGSGIGLYMSKLIMQKNNGKIRAKNVEDGAKFLLKFYKE